MRLWLFLCGLLLLVGCAGIGSGGVTDRASDSSAALRGRALFQNKGCITCHMHTQLAYSGIIVGVGPDLSHYTNDPEFLRRWLANPVAVRATAQMPNLNLTADEIADLIAFLNQPR